MNPSELDWRNAPPGDPLLVAEIEAMTPTDIEERLLAHGIYRGSGLRNYSQAKRVIFQSQWLTSSGRYDEHINVILDFLQDG